MPQGNGTTIEHHYHTEHVHHHHYYNDAETKQIDYISILVDQHRQRQAEESIINAKSIHTTKDFYRLYASLCINMGRRTGKTQWIINNATSMDFVVTKNPWMYSDISKSFETCHLSGHPPLIDYLQHLKECLFVGARFDRVICDECTKDHKDEIIQIFSDCQVNQFIFLGD